MKKPSLLLSIIPILVLTLALVAGVIVFGEDVTSGASQAALLFSAVVTSLISIFVLKIPWAKIEKSIADSLSQTTSALIVLLTIGSLTSTWMLSGVVPTLVYYGLKLIGPKIFLVSSFFLCGLISMLLGSSWTTIGTIGVAMFYAGHIIGLPDGWLAGAIISGAYMGDKISPLSDTTNLAASSAGVDLYKHVRYMTQTLIPAMAICAIIYTIAGYSLPVSTELSVHEQMEALKANFNISPWLLLIPCVTVILIVKKMSPFLTLFISALIGGITVFIAQPQMVTWVTDTEGFKGGIEAFFRMLAFSTDVHTGDGFIDGLASTGGMQGMVNTVWLIICVSVFGGAIQAGGMMQVITGKLVALAKNAFSLVASTTLTSICCNLFLGDQYMSIVMPGNLFRDAYRERGYAPELLSRALEDSATVTSVLIPWNSCAVVQSCVLGVATLTYLPFTFFCLITPLVGIVMALLNIKIHRLEPEVH